MSETLFISDLHLSEKRPELNRAFLHFLKHRAASAKALYILGDFFDSWIGDDCVQPWQTEIMLALRRYSEKHQLYIMRGNRDFLIGYDFCQQTGCVLLPDHHLVELDGKPVLLLHGDTLCTQDKGYLRYRRISRNRFIQKMFLLLPAKIRLGIASALRKTSRTSQLKTVQTPEKACRLDAQAEAIIETMRHYHVHTMIHGHTHRPAQHAHNLAKEGEPQNEAIRWVLGDWDSHWWVLSCSNGHFAQECYPLKKNALNATPLLDK